MLLKLIGALQSRPQVQWLASADISQQFPDDVLTDRTMKCETVKQIPDASYEAQLSSMTAIVCIVEQLLTANKPRAQQASLRTSTAKGHSLLPTASDCKLCFSVDGSGQVRVCIEVSQAGTHDSADTEIMQAEATASQYADAYACFWPSQAWPTPTAAEWSCLELLLTRVTLLLKLFSQPHRRRRLPDKCMSLKGSLLRIICKLLWGHVSNPELNLQRAAWELALPVVLREMAMQVSAASRDAAVWNLGTALMQRCVSDPRMLRQMTIKRWFSENQPDDMSLWRVFGRLTLNAVLGACLTSVWLHTELISVQAGVKHLVVTSCIAICHVMSCA